MALITLLRHAPLSMKYQKRYIGHSNIDIDLSLTDSKKLDILKTREYDLIYSSDLNRCMQTLDLLNFSYLKDERLREVSFKDEFEGKDFKEIELHESFNSSYLMSSKSWHEYICKESFEEYENRVKSFVENLDLTKNTLICSHAGTIRMLNSILSNYDYENSYLNVDYLDRVEIVV